MGQVERTTKLELDLGSREQGGANSEKRGYLQATKRILDSARAFYLRFFLAHPEKLLEKVQVIKQQTGEVREAPISADKLLSLSQSIRRWPPVSIPIRILIGTSVLVSLTAPGNTAAP
jgi:hypothetical protein